MEATVDGEAITNVTTVDRLLTVTLSREQVQAKAGKKVRVEADNDKFHGSGL